jgi:hypothetical protein
VFARKEALEGENTARTPAVDACSAFSNVENSAETARSSMLKAAMENGTRLAPAFRGGIEAPGEVS